MMLHHVPEPLFDQIDHHTNRPGPPSRLDVHQRKLEHDKMYLNSFEIERLSTRPMDRHLPQQFAELDILRRNDPTRIDRIRTRISNSLISIAENIRPSDARHRDIASVR
jgi:hypothetical protein